MVASSIAYTYQELQFLLKKKEILEKQQILRNQILSIRAKRELNALDTGLIHLGSQSDSLDVSASLREVEPLISQHHHMLKMLAGLNQDAVVEISLTPTRFLQAALPENLSLDLIARRPDLVALKARVEAAAKRIDAAKTDFYPNVNLMGYVGLESIFWSKLFKEDTYSGLLQPAIHLPIFTAGRLRAQLMEKVADFNDAVYAYNELILRATKEIADTLTALIYLQKEIEIRKNSLEVAEKQELLTRKRLQHAIDDRIALLQAEYKTANFELILATLEYGKILERIVLIRELGGGFHDCR